MRDHPEWSCTYADGEPIHHLSLAFKPVRDFHVELMREWVEDYRADGVNLLFSRSYPFVYYEQPVCEAFSEEHNEDMRDLPPSDRRVQKIRASFVTQLLRETRIMLDGMPALISSSSPRETWVVEAGWVTMVLEVPRWVAWIHKPSDSMILTASS